MLTPDSPATGNRRFIDSVCIKEIAYRLISLPLSCLYSSLCNDKGRSVKLVVQNGVFCVRKSDTNTTKCKEKSGGLVSEITG